MPLSQGAVVVVSSIVPTGLRDLIAHRFPTLKRGANNLCAYGAHGLP